MPLFDRVVAIVARVTVLLQVRDLFPRSQEKQNLSSVAHPRSHWQSTSHSISNFKGTIIGRSAYLPNAVGRDQVPRRVT